MVVRRFSKRGSLIQSMIMQIIIIGILFALFFLFTSQKINSNGVKQQVLEKELALLVDSARPGMEFIVEKQNPSGIVQDVRLHNGKIFVDVGTLKSFSGYPYFSLYSVRVVEEEFIFRVVVE